MKLKLEPPLPITVGTSVWNVVGLSDVGGYFLEVARDGCEPELMKVPRSFFDVIESKVFGFVSVRRERT